MDADNLDAHLQTAVELGQKIGQPVTTEKIHYAILPEDSNVYSLRELQYPHGLPPERIIANVSLADADSFCEYCLLYADDRMRVFADPLAQRFLSVLDYHGAGSDRKPEFCDHRASYKMTLSEQWKTWFGKNNVLFTQNDFADFVEDQTRDFLSPDAATMLEVARDLHAHTDVNFDSKIVPRNGQIALKYTETISSGVGTGNLEVPELFIISIPVFFGQDKIAIQIRLRFRVSQGKLSFQYKINSATDILNNAFNSSVLEVGDKLKTKVLLGTL
jgi:uncharacterized protein YfdQ (DUF2303 family)